MFSCWFGWYVGRERYYLTTRQLAEFSTYLIIAAFSLASTIALFVSRRSRREKEWPHPPLALSRTRDEEITRALALTERRVEERQCRDLAAENRRLIN